MSQKMNSPSAMAIWAAIKRRNLRSEDLKVRRLLFPMALPALGDRDFNQSITYDTGVNLCMTSFADNQTVLNYLNGGNKSLITESESR